MNQSGHRSEMEELEKGLQRVGLSLSEHHFFGKNGVEYHWHPVPLGFSGFCA
jgi:hypothetical protein